jgi:hypothetical protein
MRQARWLSATLVLYGMRTERRLSGRNGEGRQPVTEVAKREGALVHELILGFGARCETCGETRL